ncbi:hypothetical protein CB1_000968025 [Camelus ferus]|nr:hypothetical protein CB1_000968025 [Camelus ferus]
MPVLSTPLNDNASDFHHSRASCTGYPYTATCIHNCMQRPYAYLRFGIKCFCEITSQGFMKSNHPTAPDVVNMKRDPGHVNGTCFITSTEKSPAKLGRVERQCLLYFDPKQLPPYGEDERILFPEKETKNTKRVQVLTTYPAQSSQSHSGECDSRPAELRQHIRAEQATVHLLRLLCRISEEAQAEELLSCPGGFLGPYCVRLTWTVVLELALHQQRPSLVRGWTARALDVDTDTTLTPPRHTAFVC